MRKAVILSTVLVFLIGACFIYVSAQTKTRETTTRVDQKSATANPASCTSDKAGCCCSGGCQSGQHQMAAKSEEDMAKMAEGKAATSEAGCSMMHQKMMAQASNSKTEPGIQTTRQAGTMNKGCCCQKMAGSAGCGHMTRTEEKKETVTKTEVKTK